MQRYFDTIECHSTYRQLIFSLLNFILKESYIKCQRNSLADWRGTYAHETRHNEFRDKPLFPASSISS